MKRLAISLLALVACGPSTEEVRQAQKNKYELARIQAGVTLRACARADEMRTSRVQDDGSMAKECLNKQQSTDAFLGACRAYIQDATACELELRRIATDSK